MYQRNMQVICKDASPVTGCGSYSPPFRPLTDKEDEQIVQRMNETNSDTVRVGLSTPKQLAIITCDLGLRRTFSEAYILCSC